MRRIIIYNNEMQNNNLVLSVAYWVDVPASIVQAQPSGVNFPSVVSPISIAEQTALNNGTIQEFTNTLQVATTMTSSNIEGLLQLQFTTFQSQVNSTATSKTYRGAYYDDSTGWSGFPT